MDRRQITDFDFDRLDNLLETASHKQMSSDVYKEFAVMLLAAQVVPQKAVSSKVITMNTRVRLMELSSGKEVEVTIAYPHEANSSLRLVSVISRIGIALLGRRLGDIVSWPIPKGSGKFEIVEVTYQPEALGNYCE
ncbi:MAG: GreA/GreB family elongation factor [Cyclobacteriaceae bacterium]